MEQSKLDSQVIMFGNRLSKRAQHFSRWAKKERTTAYRIYDRDIPEIPLTVDFYGFVQENGSIQNKYAYVSFFERPYEKNPIEEDIWLDRMYDKVSEVLSLEPDHVIAKHRRRQRGSDQYEKKQSLRQIKGIVKEDKLLFQVNLSDYLDTGLFLDHRPLRKILTQTASDKRVLNLFGYTGALSVAAATGGAQFVQTVDLSNTYLAWARENLKLNHFLDEKNFPTTKSDVLPFLDLHSRKMESGQARGFDIILLDPPTFSNSSMTTSVLDTNRDWPQLVKNALNLLNPGGILYFSTNSRRLSFKEDLLPASVHRRELTITDITPQTLPEDFKSHRIHRCWKLSLGS